MTGGSNIEKVEDGKSEYVGVLFSSGVHSGYPLVQEGKAHRSIGAGQGLRRCETGHQEQNEVRQVRQTLPLSR